MSKLEDKLAASLKRRPAPAGTPATGKTAPRGNVKSERRADAQAGPGAAHTEDLKPAPATLPEDSRPLHPRRVWPD
jgi:hypothetical protein